MLALVLLPMLAASSVDHPPATPRITCFINSSIVVVGNGSVLLVAQANLCTADPCPHKLLSSRIDDVNNSDPHHPDTNVTRTRTTRGFARSDDGGASWAAHWILYGRQPEIPDQPCSYVLVFSNKSGALYFGHPEEALDPHNYRSNYTIRRSMDSGLSREFLSTVYPGAAGYSDMHVLPDAGGFGGDVLGVAFQKDCAPPRYSSACGLGWATVRVPSGGGQPVRVAVTDAAKPWSAPKKWCGACNARCKPGQEKGSCNYPCRAGAKGQCCVPCKHEHTHKTDDADGAPGPQRVMGWASKDCVKGNVQQMQLKLDDDALSKQAAPEDIVLLEAAGIAGDPPSLVVAGTVCGAPALLAASGKEIILLRGPVPHVADGAAAVAHCTLGNWTAGAALESESFALFGESGAASVRYTCDASGRASGVACYAGGEHRSVVAAATGTSGAAIALSARGQLFGVTASGSAAPALSPVGSDLPSAAGCEWAAIASWGPRNDRILAAQRCSGCGATAFALTANGTALSSLKLKHHDSSNIISVAVLAQQADAATLLVISAAGHAVAVRATASGALSSAGKLLQLEPRLGRPSATGLSWTHAVSAHWLGKPLASSPRQLLALRSLSKHDREVYPVPLLVLGESSFMAPRQRTVANITMQMRFSTQIDSGVFNLSLYNKRFDVEAYKRLMTRTDTNAHIYNICTRADETDADAYTNLVTILLGTAGFSVGAKPFRVFIGVLPPTEAVKDMCIIPNDDNRTSFNETSLFESVVDPFTNVSSGYFDLAGWGRLAGKLGQKFPNLGGLYLDDMTHDVYSGGKRGVVTPAAIAALQANMRLGSPALSFSPCVYYSEGSFIGNAFPGLLEVLDTPIFFFRNEKEGAGPCAKDGCKWGPSTKPPFFPPKADRKGGCLAGNCSTSTAKNAPGEIADVVGSLPRGRNLIVGFYATGHSHLGSPSAAYVEEILPLLWSSPRVVGVDVFTLAAPCGPCAAEPPPPPLPATDRWLLDLCLKGCYVQRSFANVTRSAIVKTDDTPSRELRKTYAPTWESLNSRSFPAWYNQAKVGFKRWGQRYDSQHRQEPVFAQSCLYEYFYNVKGTPTYDFHRKTYGDAPYGNFGPAFRAELYDPAAWAELFARAGARYSYMTMKHGDGFCLFDSSTQPYWNSVVMGAKRDLYGDFARAMKARGLRVGVFVELSEASNPLCPAVVTNSSTGSRIWGNCSKKLNCAGRAHNCSVAYREYLHTQIRESVERYDLDHLYLDDNAIVNYMPENASSQWFGSTQLLAELFNRPQSSEADGKPRLVVNDRWGYAARSAHVGYHLCEDTRASQLGYGCSPGFDPGNNSAGDHWAWTFGLGLGFGYNREENSTEYKTAEFILGTLVQAVRLGGSLEISLGPTSDGRIDNLVQERLLEMGSWLAVNGEAIYDSSRWKTPTDGKNNVSYTHQRSSSAVYAIMQGWPTTDHLELEAPCSTPETTVSLVGRPGAKPLHWSPLASGCGMNIELPVLRLDLLSWRHYYTFKLSSVKTDDDAGRRATLSFKGSPESFAARFSNQVANSWAGIMKHQFEPRDRFVKAINATLPAGYISTSLLGKPWQLSMWPRDTSGFLREAVAWGDLASAKANAEAIMNLGMCCDGGLPEHFDGVKPSDNGTAEDGTANVVIALASLWQRLDASDPVAGKIAAFLAPSTGRPLGRWLSSISKPPGLVAGTGEFGSGCGLPMLVYNVVQNSAVAVALRAVAAVQRARGSAASAEQLESQAARLRKSMEAALINRTDGGWIWAINTTSLTPTPDLTTPAVNVGFAGIQWGFTLSADGPAGEWTPLQHTSWPKGLSAWRKTYSRLANTPLRKRLFEQYGIFAQFDVLNQFDAAHGGLPGQGSSAYGQDYATHEMLLCDDLGSAGRAIAFLANATQHGGQTLSSDYFYERMEAPFLSPQDCVNGTPFLPMAQWGCGELNLVGVEAPTKTARLILGVDDTNASGTRLLPRLPPGWREATAKMWPVLTPAGLVRVNISVVQSSAADGGCGGVTLDVLDGAEIPSLELRCGGLRWTQYERVKHLSF